MHSVSLDTVFINDLKNYIYIKKGYTQYNGLKFYYNYFLFKYDIIK